MKTPEVLTCLFDDVQRQISYNTIINHMLNLLSDCYPIAPMASADTTKDAGILVTEARRLLPVAESVPVKAQTSVGL